MCAARIRFRHTWFAVGSLLVSLAAAGARTTAQHPASPNPDAKLVAEFQAKVAEYVELHRRLEATLPPRPSDANVDEIQNNQHALERLIARARAEVKPGHIFTEQVRPYFRRQLARVFAGPEGHAALEAIMEENPRTLRLRVNAEYPRDLPVSSVPPRVLLVLPKLPPELDYRFMGERLVLLDTHANIVVDFMEDAIIR